jgi:hypothetical protein
VVWKYNVVQSCRTPWVRIPKLFYPHAFSYLDSQTRKKLHEFKSTRIHCVSDKRLNYGFILQFIAITHNQCCHPHIQYRPIAERKFHFPACSFLHPCVDVNVYARVCVCVCVCVCVRARARMYICVSKGASNSMAIFVHITLRFKKPIIKSFTKFN